MIGQSTNRFQILALSGGGFRGLYTAKILADIEDDIQASISSKFDLIAGTSIGGILAMAIACEIPAKNMVELFEKHGDDIFRKRFSLMGICRAFYDSDPLKKLLSSNELLGNRLLGFCRHPVIIPAINYTTGRPVLFKTPHHADFKRDHQLKLADIAMATSAAPSYYPRHVFNNNQYVDGGLFANAPGLLAVHEAEMFFGQDRSNIHLLSIGTMSSMFTVDPGHNRAGGTYDWGGLNPANTPKRLFGLAISVQESITHNMLTHKLPGDRYLHVDDVITDQSANAVALDKTDAAAREALLGSATERSKICLGDAQFNKFMAHTPSTPVFHYGENANLA